MDLRVQREADMRGKGPEVNRQSEKGRETGRKKKNNREIKRVKRRKERQRDRQWKEGQRERQGQEVNESNRMSGGGVQTDKQTERQTLQ